MARPVALEWIRLLASLVGPTAVVLACTGHLVGDAWERARWRAVHDARSDAGTLRALGVALPVLGDGLPYKGRSVPRIVADANGISVDHAGWLLALPDGTRGPLRAALRERGVDLGELGAPRRVGWAADGSLHPDVAGVLAQRRELREALATLGDDLGENGHMMDDLGDVLVLADGALPAGRVLQLLYTALQGETSGIQVGVDLPGREGVGRLALAPGHPRGCTEDPPPACNRVAATLRQAPERLDVAITPGPCVVEPPPPCAPGPIAVGTCAVLPGAEPGAWELRTALSRMPVCDPLVVAAEPDVPWERVVRVGWVLVRGFPHVLTLGVAAPQPIAP